MLPDSKEEKYKPTKLKWSGVLLTFSIFVFAGFLMSGKSDHTGFDSFMGIYLMFFGGVGILVSILQFIPNVSFLRLTPEGFEMKSLGRCHSYKWSEIREFGVAEFQTRQGGMQSSHRLVGFNFKKPGKSDEVENSIRRLNRRVVNYEAALPDNYGWKNTELATHLNELRIYYVNKLK
ncbi:MAG: hypothetical protein ABUK01_10320 [Leptospirales bacterium]